MNPFRHDLLFDKSRLFIQRALSARSQDDNGGFGLWAALSLELLGKACLAAIHPTLVADPSHFESLLTATEHGSALSTRSITAKTVFERLRRVLRDFDTAEEKFCMLLANRRNEDLHSGLLAFEGVNADVWVPQYWRISKAILGGMGRDLGDWLGEPEASRAEAVLAESLTTLEQAVLGRVDACRASFEERYLPYARLAVRAESQRNWDWSLFGGLRGGDVTISQDCPACRCRGALAGDEWYNERETIEDEDTGPTVWVTSHYTALGFECRICGLRLTSREECGIAELPETFEMENEAEPDYEPDYGNE